MELHKNVMEKVCFYKFHKFNKDKKYSVYSLYNYRRKKNFTPSARSDFLWYALYIISNVVPLFITLYIPIISVHMFPKLDLHNFILSQSFKMEFAIYFFTISARDFGARIQIAYDHILINTDVVKEDISLWLKLQFY